MTTELKPCPFCGGEAKYHEDNGEYQNYVTCQNKECGMYTYGEWMHDPTTITRWNTRAAPDVPELVRYKPDSYDAPSISRMLKDKEGSYVRYEQAAAIIEALKAELYDLAEVKDRALEWRDYDRERAFTAEADRHRLRKALEPFASYGGDHFDKDHEGNMLPDEGVVGWVYLNFGHFRKARAALERMSHDKNN